MKINGFVLGYYVVNLDFGEVFDWFVVKELEKLNLVLEMGDNVMIYLDDI